MYMQVWLNIEYYVFFNLLSKFEEKSHNIADPYNFSYFFWHSTMHCKGPQGQLIFVKLDTFWIIALLCKLKKIVKTSDSTFLQLLCFFQWLSYHMGLPSTLIKIRKNSTADIMSWLTAPRWQMIWGCFRSFALHRIRVLPDLMMDTHIDVLQLAGIACSFGPPEFTSDSSGVRVVHVHLWFFVLYRLVVVGLFLCFPGLYFVHGYCLLITSDLNWQPFGISDWHQNCNTYLVNVLRTVLKYLVSFKYSDSWEVFFCAWQILREGQVFFQRFIDKKMQHLCNMVNA